MGRGEGQIDRAGTSSGQRQSLRGRCKPPVPGSRCRAGQTDKRQAQVGQQRLSLCSGRKPAGSLSGRNDSLTGREQPRACGASRNALRATHACHSPNTYHSLTHSSGHPLTRIGEAAAGTDAAIARCPAVALWRGRWQQGVAVHPDEAALGRVHALERAGGWRCGEVVGSVLSE